MEEFIIFMAPAFFMCLILVGICGYVGIHVIMREVIFIDIALAQVAALGASVGMFMELDLHSPWTYVISLSFTLAGALLLSGTRALESRVPQEAFIGILYAVGAAAVLIAGDRLPHGSEHVHDLMCGHLLWVTWREVGVYLVIYVIIGLVYMVFHSRLYAISADKLAAKAAGVRLMRWDFIFYALLGVLVTFAVRVAGVMVVFGFLIVPAVIGAMLADSFIKKMAIGWSTGVIISMLGCAASYYIDLPTGATVVVSLGAALLIIALLKGLSLKSSEKTESGEG